MEYIAAHTSGITHSTQLVIFAGLFIGFAIKVPMFPFHTWLPDAHTQAPTVGLRDPRGDPAEARHVRVHPHRDPDPARRRVSWAPWIGLLAVIGIIYGALCCLAQTDMKRLIAFSSVAHMGFVMLGIATLTSFGLNAAVFGMVAHGLITGMLFFLAGSVKERYHTLEIRQMGGLLATHPALRLDPRLLRDGLARLARASPGSGASSPRSSRRTARPPGCPKASSAPTWSSPRSARCSPPLICSGCTSAPRSATSARRFAHEPAHDVTIPEWIAWTPLLIGIVVLGIFPNLIFGMTDDAVGTALRARRRLSRCIVLAQASSGWQQPNVDYHALAPVIVLAGAIVVVLLVDLLLDERQKWATSSIAGLGLLASLVPVLTLAVDGTDRSMFGGAYVVDNFSLVMKGMFLITGYAVVLISTRYIDEGDYYEGEYYTLLLCSILGMVMIASSPRPGLAVHRARAAVDPRVHARRLAQARPQEQRGGDEVLPARRVRLGRDALRDVAALRRHRHRRLLAAIGEKIGVGIDRSRSPRSRSCS